ncbi:MAG: 30S ribosomal protein S1 [Anaerolineaceae bacterium]
MDKKVIDEVDCNLPELDEGWWNSVLADESAVSPEPKQVNCKPCGQSTPSTVNWTCVKDLFERDEIILLQVQGFNRGGLLVQGEGVQGFVPISHIVDAPTNLSEDERYHFLEVYVGKSLYLKVIECEQANERVVLSERAAQAGQGKRKELFDSLKPGVIACGVITNVTDFGAFVDLGGVEGLIHVSEMSWGRVDKPTEMFKIGQSVKVIILQVQEENSRIALSIKRLSPNPWEELLENYKPGDIVTAEITSIMKFGVFARLNEGIEGLIHISSLPHEVAGADWQSLFEQGQPVQVKILHIDAERRRLGLGLVTTE